MKIGDRVKVAATPRYPGGRIGIVRDVYEDEFGRWFEIESNKDRGVFWTLTQMQVEPLTPWLNVDFVPNNQVTFDAMARHETHQEDLDRFAALSATASKYPIGSVERTAIMDQVISGMIASDAKAGLR